MGKIALQLQNAVAHRELHGLSGRTTARVIARGEGWTVADVMCTSGPRDRAFEEQHAHYTIAIVLAGTFQYRAQSGHALMTPGSLMLGSRRQCFECGHEHGEGDRCVSFWYETDYFERMAVDGGARRTASAWSGLSGISGFSRFSGFKVPRIAPLRSLTPLVAAAAAGVMAPDRLSRLSWEELGIKLAAHVVELTSGAPTPAGSGYRAPANAESSVTRVVRAIDRAPAAPLTLAQMAREAGLSPYHFLRTFERVTGVTPHQYILRARLRDAALRLASGPGKIVDIALDSGFGDISNFNRAFRAEFGVTPRAYQSR